MHSLAPVDVGDGIVDVQDPLSRELTNSYRNDLLRRLLEIHQRVKIEQYISRINISEVNVDCLLWWWGYVCKCKLYK